MKWSEMTYEQKKLNLIQCYEAGYSWEALICKCDILQNLQTGYENDPEWFGFEIENADWVNLFEIFAQILAEKGGFDNTEMAAKYILQWHNEGIDYNREDVEFYIDDLKSE